MQKSSLYHKAIYSMNSCLDIIIPGIEPLLAEKMCSEVEQEAFLLEKILSCHNPEAETFKVNKLAFHENVQVSDILWNTVSEAIRFHSLTHGYFDAGLKNLKHTGHPVEPGNGIACVRLAGQTVRFTSPHTSLDFGGIGKGILLKETGKILDRYNVQNCFISFGGSSILTRGSHPHGHSWPVSFRDETCSADFHLNNHCASFSGAFNKAAYHIINPQTNKPQEGTRVTFVQTQCPVEAEALSTTLVLTTLNEAEEITNHFKPEKAIIFEKNLQQELSLIYSYEPTK